MSDYEQFAKRFSVRNMQVVRDRGYDSFVYGHNRNTSSYYNDREELIEIELTRSGFEQLIRIDREYDRIWEADRAEAFLRMEHPAIAEAYSKYKMLLELYK